MAVIHPIERRISAPHPAAVLELLKPLTWFAPMWAFACGAVSVGADAQRGWLTVIAGVILAGPLLCATSQAVNDWFDRNVDAINEPGRPIPSGRVPGAWGLYIGVAWSAASLIVAAALGVWVLGAAALGLVLAWVYSAPPLRLKTNGWLGPAAVALAYEGLAWFTGAAVLAGGFPDARSVALAALYSVGAHGIMTLNDFKAVEGDRATGVRSLPASLGPERAVKIACVVMTAPQVVVVALLFAWGAPVHAAFVCGLLAVQLVLMARLAQAPRERAPWYNATGTTFYVLGMMASALAVGGLG